MTSLSHHHLRPHEMKFHGSCVIGPYLLKSSKHGLCLGADDTLSLLFSLLYSLPSLAQSSLVITQPSPAHVSTNYHDLNRLYAHRQRAKKARTLKLMSYIMSSYPEKKCSLPQLLKFINPAKHGIFIAFIMFIILSPAIQLADAQAGPDQSKDPYAYAKFSPSMAIIIVVLVAALFFMAFFSIYIRHCNESRTGSSLRPNGGSIRGRSRRAARGLDPTVIETFPTFAYSVVKGLKIGKGALECAVCLNEFEEDETLRLLPKCDHVFHPECIDAWLASHTTCPVCRANLAAPADEVVAGEVVVEVSDSDSDTDELTPGSELQNSTSIRVIEDEDRDQAEQPIRPQVIDPSRSVHQNRPGRSKSITSRFFPKYPRSHSTGHSLIQPGENVDRFTLRLPADVRKQIMNKTLNRASSLVILPRETSCRRGYRLGGEGSGRGRHFSFRRLERLDQEVKSDRWVFSRTPPFFSRASSLRSPKVMTDDGEGTSSEAPKGSNAV